MRGQIAATRTFWWDRTSDADVDPLRAVIFDLDGAVADLDLIDLVMSLFVAGVWVGVVSTGSRTQVEPRVRELFGDGLVETIVTRDDADSSDRTDLYELALWEFGIEADSALAIVGSAAAEEAAVDTGVATVLVSTTDDTAEVNDVAACERLHRRWWTARKLAAA